MAPPFFYRCYNFLTEDGTARIVNPSIDETTKCSIDLVSDCLTAKEIE